MAYGMEEYKNLLEDVLLVVFLANGVSSSVPDRSHLVERQCRDFFFRHGTTTVRAASQRGRSCDDGEGGNGRHYRCRSGRAALESGT